MTSTPPSSPGTMAVNKSRTATPEAKKNVAETRFQPYRRNEKKKVLFNKLGNLLLTTSHTDEWGTSIFIREVPKDLVPVFLAAQKAKKHEEVAGLHRDLLGGEVRK